MEDALVLNYKDINDEIIIDDDESLLQTLIPPQNEMVETEEVDNETERGEIEGVESENYGVESENKEVDNKFLPTEQK